MLSERLRELLNEKKLSLAAFAEMSSLPLETVRNVYYGKTADPKISTVLQMANALGMSVNQLMGQEEPQQEEKTIVNYYRQCGRHGKSVISLVAKYEAVSARAERDAGKKHKIPCLIPCNNIAAGIIYDSCETAEFETSVEDAFAGIQITSNDLVPMFCKGDVVLIANRFPMHGEYGAFIQGDRAYIRKYLEEDGKYRLKCLHNMGEDIVVDRLDQVEYIGTCIDVMRI